MTRTPARKPAKGAKGAFRRRETAKAKAAPWLPGAGYRDTGLCPALGPQDQECMKDGSHRAMHLAACGFAWDDEGRTIQFPMPTGGDQ